ADDVRPERVRIRRAREHRGDADHCDVGAAGALVGPVRARRGMIDECGAALRDIRVELGDAAYAIAQRSDLADHVHALALLDVVPAAVDPLAVAAQALRGDAQPAEVELLERRPDLLRRRAGLFEPALLLGERVRERGVRAARRVTGRGLEQHGALARDRL